MSLFTTRFLHGPRQADAPVSAIVPSHEADFTDQLTTIVIVVNATLNSQAAKHLPVNTNNPDKPLIQPVSRHLKPMKADPW
jgi:hypothetical protein